MKKLLFALLVLGVPAGLLGAAPDERSLAYWQEEVPESSDFTVKIIINGIIFPVTGVTKENTVDEVLDGLYDQHSDLARAVGGGTFSRHKGDKIFYRDKPISRNDTIQKIGINKFSGFPITITTGEYK